MTPFALTVVRSSIATHSKSFALASRVLSPSVRDDTAALYAFCRRADDAVDLDGARPKRDAVATLEAELASVYAGEAQPDATLAAFQEVVQRHRVPRTYPAELLAGMRMDAEDFSYAHIGDLYTYCYRVAGTVGLMMSHVLGVTDASALRHAAHLGMAMQLTNVCRDVREDWNRGRLYVPDALLAGLGKADLGARLGESLPEDAREALASSTRFLLSRADALYASGDRGIPFLPFRAAAAVRTARLVYADIGRVILERNADPFAPRAVVPTGRKLRLAARAIGRTLVDSPWRFRRAEISHVIGVEDVLPV